jgi:hypothetical protein
MLGFGELLGSVGFLLGHVTQMRVLAHGFNTSFWASIAVGEKPVPTFSRDALRAVHAHHPRTSRAPRCASFA